MSHLTFITLGSRGDVVPYLALGQRLRAAGHTVRMATHANFGAWVAAHGLDFHPIDVDIEALATGTAGRQLMSGGQNIVRQVLGIRRTFGRMADAIARDLLHPALRATDAILCQTPGALYGADLAEALGVPLIRLAVMPLARTRQWPHLSFPAQLGRVPGFTRASYPIVEQLVWQMFRAPINRWRRGLGLRPLSLRGYFHQLEARRVPMLKGFSPLVVPRPPDWPAYIHQTGYWYPHDPAWQPPPALLRFLESGPPPVFIGFGSMPLRDPAGTTSTLLEALRMTGQRGLFHAGWGGLGARHLPPTVFPLQYAAFEWLFPRAGAIVHHGGAGTTGMALRAGVPSLVVPFVFDQFFWAERVAALGVGPPALPYARLTARRLAAAMDRAVSDPALRQRAKALGAKLNVEDGLTQATSLIERYSVTVTASDR